MKLSTTKVTKKYKNRKNNKDMSRKNEFKVD